MRLDAGERAPKELAVVQRDLALASRERRPVVSFRWRRRALRELLQPAHRAAVQGVVESRWLGLRRRGRGRLEAARVWALAGHRPQHRRQQAATGGPLAAAAQQRLRHLACTMTATSAASRESREMNCLHGKNRAPLCRAGLVQVRAQVRETSRAGFYVQNGFRPPRHPCRSNESLSAPSGGVAAFLYVHCLN